MNSRFIAAIKAQNFTLSSLRRSAFFKEFLLFASSTVFYQCSRFAVGLGAARLLGPQTYGLWNALNLILVYGGVTGFGVLNAMNRDVPLFKGKGDLRRVEKIRQVSWGAILCSSLTAGGILVLIAALLPLPPVLKSSLRWMALLFIAFQLYGYLQLYLKSDLRFAWMSYQQFAFAALLPLIAIPFIFLYGLQGYILGQVLVIALISLLIARFIPFSFRPKLELREVLHLAKVGAPIMAVGLLYGLLTTVDRWVILSFLGVKELGYYSLVIMVESVVSLVPLTIAQQIYPRMAETFGSTSNYSSLKKWIMRHITMATGVTVPLLIGLYFLFPPLVHRLLPDYVPGITAMKIILLGLLFLPLSGGFGNFLNTVDKQVYNMVVQGFAVLVNLGLNISFVRMGLGIDGVAMGTALTYALYSWTLLLVGNRIIKGGSRPAVTGGK